ncbi:uncharacterized protein LTR77_005007 [Saxophila tyrrhenica]|uniref:Uncharacterized protein n=1 Tax=Saxophila tyrrhenica TaxID=1690608 RepID=A0AAV9PD67_9PEZI|nr:hypothetical protein LTR77_005007 [Saxophila tyrrhenica]
MDLSNDDPNGGPFSTRSPTTFEGRPSLEGRSPRTPPRQLQKQRSNAGVRATIHQNLTNHVNDRQQEHAGAKEDNKVRKGSLRNAVRRLFGRRSREVQPQPEKVSPPRHAYSRSDPYTVLSPQPEVLEDTAQEDDFIHRTFSAPIGILPSPAVQRTRSPYAVEFPQSSRLKPINLGNPYTAPGSQLRRRKTLPSVRPAEIEAKATSDSDPLAEVLPTHVEDENEIGRAVSTSERSQKRRSRSAGDLRQVLAQTAPKRKRSDEIRYWRESFQGSVLRASGFMVPVIDDPQDAHVEEEKTPTARQDDPLGNPACPAQSSPPRRKMDVHGSDFTSPSAFGSQLSQDLEDRVARLEAGLRSFRGELAQISADRNRRTVLIGGIPTPTLHRRASSGGRSASMLAETLQNDLGPSAYHYDYSDTLRPATSPPPRTPSAPNPEPPALPTGSRGQPRPEDPFISTPQQPARVTSAPADNVELSAGLPQHQPPQYTFRSLYEMLSDERSARRRLEMQMRGLRQEIADLHYQVSSVSNFASQRSSYNAGLDPTAGSTRLHALLRDTEESPPQTRRGQRGQAMTGMVSRFSGSESEVAGGEGETPYEVFQTPVERTGAFDWGSHATAGAGRGAGREREGEMF